MGVASVVSWDTSSYGGVEGGGTGGGEGGGDSEWTGDKGWPASMVTVCRLETSEAGVGIYVASMG